MKQSNWWYNEKTIERGLIASRIHVQINPLFVTKSTYLGELVDRERIKDERLSRMESV